MDLVVNRVRNLPAIQRYQAVALLGYSLLVFFAILAVSKDNGATLVACSLPAPLTISSANRVLLTWDRNLSIRYEADKQRQHLER